MWVVKIGGSLETAPGLRALLEVLVEYGRAKIIIVPGGGRFADKVRAEQKGMAMDDATAHRLAIQGMEHYAAVLCGIDTRLYPVTDPEAPGSAGDIVSVPVWLPGKLLADQPGIPCNWQVTSDSLALWLADRMGAEALILVKSAANRSADVVRLAEAGYLDEYFPRMLEQTSVGEIACMCINDRGILQQALVSGTIPHGIRIAGARRVASRDGRDEKKGTGLPRPPFSVN